MTATPMAATMFVKQMMLACIVPPPAPAIMLIAALASIQRISAAQKKLATVAFMV